MKGESTYKVEKGISMPTSFNNVHNLPFDEMDVMDSFLISFENFGTKKNAQAIILNESRKYKLVINKHFKITTRSTDEGIRIWRVK
jgi:hypothetical protein